MLSVLSFAWYSSNLVAAACLSLCHGGGRFFPLVLILPLWWCSTWNRHLGFYVQPPKGYWHCSRASQQRQYPNQCQPYQEFIRVGFLIIKRSRVRVQQLLVLFHLLSISSLLVTGTNSSEFIILRPKNNCALQLGSVKSGSTLLWKTRPNVTRVPRFKLGIKFT